MRQPLVVGNWKMNGCYVDNKARLDELQRQLDQLSNVRVALCPPFTYIPRIIELLQNSDISCGSQNVSEHLDGAHTGEISAAMLSDIGCRFAIIGHSERRQYHHETNSQVAQKTLAALKAGLMPIICVGESREQRQAEKTLDIIEEQLSAITQSLNTDHLAHIVIAYEPIWAIGTGLTATPEQAQAVHSFIRQQLTADKALAAKIPLLYGGSVKPDNAASLFCQPDIDGALVGGASLVARDFIAIVQAAEAI